MVIRNVPSLLILVLFCGAAAAEESSGAITADESAGALTTFPLPNVVVIGKRVAAPPTIIVREASETDFIEWNVRTAAGALARTPGVNVQIGGSSGDASPWIRGFRDRDILVLFDRILEQSLFQGMLFT
jgi:outer membrane cobalamin receptor